MTEVYYLEWDEKKAAWLAELVKQKLIPPGPIDTRDIREVEADDLRGYDRVSMFAGIGGWEHGLSLGRWPDDRSGWTVSCPCPPFSAAGKKKSCPECGGRSPVPCPRRTGFFICCECEHAWHADERHLWPEVWRLIRDARPPEVLGEQVASGDGRVWFALVRASLEALGYAVGSTDLCSAGVGAPNIRQRLWFGARRRADTGCGVDERCGGPGEARGSTPTTQGEMGELERGGTPDRSGGALSRLALSDGRERHGRPEACLGDLDDRTASGRLEGVRLAADGGRGHWLVDRILSRLEGHGGHERDGHEPGRLDTYPAGPASETGWAGRVADAAGEQCDQGRVGTASLELGEVERSARHRPASREAAVKSGLSKFGRTRGSDPHHVDWRNTDWLFCRDGKWRPVKSGVLGVADGLPAGVVRDGSASFPLIEGAEARTLRLSGYGDAVNPYAVAAFVRAWLTC